MSTELVSEMDMAIRLWLGDQEIELAIFDAPPDELSEFADTITCITSHHCRPKKNVNENFSFTANSALSGGAHPCAAPACRVAKIEGLISFAALYADEVYIRNPFEYIALKDPRDIREVDRHNLIAGIYNYLLLRPMIERGIIKYAHDLNPFCDHHHDHFATPLIEKINRKAEALAFNISQELLDQCVVKFNSINPKSPFFEVSGPDGIIEHGTVFYHPYHPPSPIFKKFKKKGPIYTLQKSEVEDSGALDMVVNPIMQDIVFQEWHTTLSGTSYLCDNSAHMALVSSINNKAFAADSQAFKKNVQHYLPQVQSRDPLDLLAIREREQEAFFVYRDKLRKIINNKWSDRELAAIFRDEIQPEINSINKKLRDWKTNSRQSLGEKLLFGTGSVTLGLYAGILPPNVGQLVAALGGVSAAAGIIMEWNKTLKDKQQARASDFFFLWEAASGK
jgi:hypothetical protein